MYKWGSTASIPRSGQGSFYSPSVVCVELAIATREVLTVTAIVLPHSQATREVCRLGYGRSGHETQNGHCRDAGEAHVVYYCECSGGS